MALAQRNHGAFIVWFDPGELLKNRTAPLATSATFATLEAENSKSEGQSRKVAEVAEVAEGQSPENLIVTCYTPNGTPIEVEATSTDHAEFLQHMNPIPNHRQGIPK